MSGCDAQHSALDGLALAGTWTLDKGGTTTPETAGWTGKL